MSLKIVFEIYIKENKDVEYYEGNSCTSCAAPVQCSSEHIQVPCLEKRLWMKAEYCFREDSVNTVEGIWGYVLGKRRQLITGC